MLLEVQPFLRIEKFREAYDELVEALKNTAEDTVVASICGITLRAYDLCTLFRNELVNDNVMQAFLKLLQLDVNRRYSSYSSTMVVTSASQSNGESLPCIIEPVFQQQKRVLIVDSMFYSKLTSSQFESFEINFANVKRWYRRTSKDCGIFSYSMVVVPINKHNLHWFQVVLNMKTCLMSFYESLEFPSYTRRDAKRIMSNLIQFLIGAYARDYGGAAYPYEKSWRMEIVEGLPHQIEQDCGPFTCMFADYAAHDHPVSSIKWSRDVTYIRPRMMCSLLTGKMMY